MRQSKTNQLKKQNQQRQTQKQWINKHKRPTTNLIINIKQNYKAKKTVTLLRGKKQKKKQQKTTTITNKLRLQKIINNIKQAVIPYYNTAVNN